MTEADRIRARAKREWSKRDLRKWAMLAMLADEADKIREVRDVASN